MKPDSNVTSIQKDKKLSHLKIRLDFLKNSILSVWMKFFWKVFHGFFQEGFCLASFIQWVLTWQVFLWVFSKRSLHMSFVLTNSFQGVFLTFPMILWMVNFETFQRFFDSVGLVDWSSLIFVFVVFQKNGLHQNSD